MAVNSFNAQNPPVNTKGDVFTFSTIPTRLGVGANDTVLTADSSTATGLKWAAPSSTGTLAQITNGSFPGSAASLTISSLSDYDYLLLTVNNIYFSAATATDVYYRINGDSDAKYTVAQMGYGAGASYATTQPTLGHSSRYGGQSTQIFAKITTTTALPDWYYDTNINSSWLELKNCKATGFTNFTLYSAWSSTSDVNGRRVMSITNGVYTNAAAVSSLVISLNGAGNISGGSYTMWGY